MKNVKIVAHCSHKGVGKSTVVKSLLVEHLSALCPSDSWHAKSGYIGSKRAMSGLEYRRKRGL
jgi:hypothetical protein